MQRDPEIQTLRGLACILLVVYHVVGDDSASGLRVADESAWRFFVELFAHLRMPLFSFLSGYVYALRPLQAGQTAEFLRKKAWRLYVPLVAVSTLYFVLHAYTPGVNAEQEPWSGIWRIYFFPYTHFWFLQALLVIFLVLAVLEMSGVMKTLRGFCATLVVVLVVHWGDFVDTGFFSIEQASYLLPYFLLGLGVRRFREELSLRTIGIVCVPVFVVLLAYRAATLCGYLGEPAGQRAFVSTLEGVSGLLSLAIFMPRRGGLASVGAYSFTIYLYHVFFTAGSRLVMVRLGWAGIPAGFVAGIVCGLLGPILLHDALLRAPLLLQRIFLGTRSPVRWA